MLSVPQFSTPDLCAASYLRWVNPKRFSTIRRPLGATAEVTPHYTVVSWLDTGVRGDTWSPIDVEWLTLDQPGAYWLVPDKRSVTLAYSSTALESNRLTLVTGYISALLI
ncbi:hypothetical protein BDQ94DRAFT_47728 [Aspergillus welwitschiae]|uniref:Uncharacterized protein n=1 Tax=Aspergillus welwitschiae TaxID=1341132 RepID=A0A3F3QIS8_9EURO|nr:hypothetical protein BDQ94DRAFT_47728 [Aspergillus welwitschiae]RDH38772.1 hypothetical protein BDQ94DRAFT_47728 [Aspergillus welwitschiae]